MSKDYCGQPAENYNSC